MSDEFGTPIEATVEEAVKSAQDWRHAVTNLIDYYTSNDLCFSSGEIAAEMRTHRNDLNFSVFWVGDYVRDLFYTGSIRYTVKGNAGDSDAAQVPAFQVTRVTEGRFPNRTPAGISVFVYGPHPTLCEQHDFEVEIPKAPNFLYQESDIPDHGEDWYEDEKVQARRAPGDMTVRVHTDRRVCFTRPLLEAFFHARKQPVQAGGNVYIRESNGKIILTVTEEDGASPYSLSTSRGRVLYPLSSVSPGTALKVDITRDAIIVDLDN